MTSWVAPLFKERVTPKGAAASVFLGVFIAHVPIYGFQTVVAIALAVALKLNKPITVAASFINNPFLQPLLIFLSVQLGSLALKGQFVEISIASLRGMSPGEHLWTWLTGSILLGLLLGVLLGGVAFVAGYAFAPHGAPPPALALYRNCPPSARRFARWKLRLDRIFDILRGEDLGTGRVVDLGCGYGVTLAMIAADAPQRELAGCDLSGERIRAARQALPENAGSLVVSDVCSYEIGSAGLILIMDVLQYLSPGKQAELLARCAHALQPGGKLIFRVHDREAGLRSRVVLIFDKLMMAEPQNLPAEAYRDVIAKAGLTLRERRFTNRLPFAHILYIAEKSA
jgi:uncharacterized protein (DUF2062 family)